MPIMFLPLVFPLKKYSLTKQYPKFIANRANSQIATNHPALSPAINKFDSIINTNPKIKPIFTIDRKSTRLNSSHVSISYAVFCLKKKKSEGQAVQDKVDNNGQQ